MRANLNGGIASMTFIRFNDIDGHIYAIATNSFDEIIPIKIKRLLLFVLI